MTSKAQVRYDYPGFQSDHFLFFFLFSRSLVKMTILIEINNGQPIPLMWYILILSLFFRILALENIAKILTTGPRLGMICEKYIRLLFHYFQYSFRLFKPSTVLGLEYSVLTRSILCLIDKSSHFCNTGNIYEVAKQ